MNPLNIRSARRAIHRLTSFEHLVRKVYHFVRPKPHTSHFKFRRRKRR